MKAQTPVRPLRPWHRFTLFQRIMLLVGLGLAASATFQLAYSEKLLEDAILTQVKHEAVVFLLGIEREIQGHPWPPQREQMRQSISHALSHDIDVLSFAVESMYVFDRQGNVLIHTEAGEHPARDMSSHYGDVVNSGTPYLGSEIEWDYDPEAGREVPRMDVIVPLHIRDAIVGGIEIEINLEQTMELIGQLDDGSETAFALLQLSIALATLGFIWLVLRNGMIGPIRRLGSATEKIAAGDLGARAEHEGSDELGRLGQAVNRMADSIEELFDEQERAYLGMLQSLAKALEKKDAYTAGHSGRVARFAVMLGRRMALSEQELTILKQGALMHDLGKIGIPDAILNKKGPLNEREYEIMKAHPEYTATIMKPLRRFKAFAEIARWHHERWDGYGYPDGLAGEAIPRLARIVAIADTWDAMTGDRVYREGVSVEQALEILEAERYSGQWDPDLLGEFIDMIRAEHGIRQEVLEDMSMGQV